MTLSRKPREEKDFVYHLGNVVEQVRSVYSHLMPAQSDGAFETIWKAAVLANTDPDTVAQNCRAAGQLKLMNLILLACAYAAHAGREHHDGRREIAWTYLVEAQYYAGAALYGKALEVAWPGIEQITVQTAVADVKSKGGRAKNAGWKRIEDEAVRLVMILGEQGERWNNERKMAISIKSELLPFALLEIPGLSEKRYIQTISDRLKQRRADVGTYLNKKG